MELCCVNVWWVLLPENKVHSLINEEEKASLPHIGLLSASGKLGCLSRHHLFDNYCLCEKHTVCLMQLSYGVVSFWVLGMFLNSLLIERLLLLAPSPQELTLRRVNLSAQCGASLKILSKEANFWNVKTTGTVDHWVITSAKHKFSSTRQSVVSLNATSKKCLDPILKTFANG